VSVVDELLSANERYAAGMAGLPAAAPARGVAVVTCMDTRLNPYPILGLAVGDAHVVRNAGGVVTDDVLRSLVISQRLLGTREVLLVQHTGCGLLGLDDEEFRRTLRAATGREPGWAAGGFGDLESSVRAGVAALRCCPFLPRTDAIRGAVFDVATGRLREVR
jgi:carbonic anhydrase